MPGGLTGKILRVNLKTKEISTIASEKYAEFGGGHGMGSALFFDLVGKQLPFPAFDPRNVVVMTASPFAGTFVPGSGRCEVQSLSPMLYPVEWFGHSNFGGRFTSQLKFAGWDAIAVEGASDEPVWINVVNDQVKIESANGIWGKNTWEAQEEISRRVVPGLQMGEWAEFSQNAYTSQVPAVVTCGPVGESMSRLGCLLHGPGSQAALCGFGAVFGSKKLKAISVLGTGSAPIADPKAFMDARLWFRKFQWDVDNPRDPEIFENGYALIAGKPKGGNVANRLPSRAAACASCPRGCKERTADASTNEAVCAGTMIGGNDVMHRWGAGHWQVMATTGYMQALEREGIIGPGTKYDPGDMPTQGGGFGGGGFGGGGSGSAYYEALYEKMAKQDDEYGKLISLAAARMAEKLGRYPQDVNDGTVRLTYWGTREHYPTQVQVDWGYGSIFGERDLMLHQMSNYPLHWMAQERNPYLTAEEASDLYRQAMVPYNDDRYLVDYGESPETGIYSDSKIKLVAWVKHYEKFWMGMGFCGWRWPMCITNNTADRRGATPEAEPRFWNAVTGQNITFADSMEIGHKIYTLDRSIWVLQGRTKKMETFPDYIYDQSNQIENALPMYVDGKWIYEAGLGRKLDRAKFEDFKERFYKFEGYNPDNGFPTEATLTKMNMPKVAETLKKIDKLG